MHHSTEQERDNIDHEASVFVKACKDQIDFLKNRIHEEEKDGNSTGWLSMRDESSHADVVAHKHGVVLILSERLHSVTAQFDRLRSIRFQDAVNRAMPRRKMHKAPDTKSSESSKSDLREFGVQELPSSSGSVRVQDQLSDDETRALQVELTSLLDAVQETETKMVEMLALNHLMSTHVLQQAQQIEHLYDQVLILIERLHSVTDQFDRLRSIRFQDAVNRAMPRRKMHRAPYTKSSESSKSDLREFGVQELPSSSGSVRVQIQLSDDETRALQAVEATKNVVLGNKELAQAIKRNSSSRTFILLFLFVLTFSILFLDWYS